MLDNRVAIITGAASGIGEASVRLFSEQRARVLAVDLDGERLRQVFKGMAQVVVIEQDVAASDAPDRIIKCALDHWGSVDILFNNAGVGARVPGEAEYRMIADTPDDHWNRVIDINLTAQFRLTRAAMEMLRKSSVGRVIFTGSPLADRPTHGVSTYSAAKAALAAFARAIALEEGPNGITSNWLEPGAILTGMTHHMHADGPGREAWEQKSPLRRIGMPIDVARAALFLASDLSSFITGQGLRVDGGTTLQV
jgi:3-oxoacyl-[acyl-carrier protein] reductase